MAYAIRPFIAEDATALAELTIAAIRTIGPEKYSYEQIEAWASRHPGPQRFIDRTRSGASIFVAADADDQPVAYALLEPDGHLDMLYCHPEHTRRGLANELLAATEQHARTKGLKRLHTEASEPARSAFERAGFAVQHRRDFELDHEGRSVAIHNFAMEKPLT